MVAMVNGPKRPINIVNIRMSLLKEDNSVVMPVDKPTVPKADTTSKSTCINEYSGSIILIKNVSTHIKESAKNVIMNAFVTTSCGMRLLKAQQCLFVAILYALLNKVNAVVVLIPPPVDPEMHQ